MAHLYELAGRIVELIDDDENYDEETGELKPEVQALLDTLEEDTQKTGLDIAVYIKNLKTLRKNIADEKIRQTERQGVMDRRMASLKEYLLVHLDRAGLKGKKLSDGRVGISFRKTKKVVVDCEAHVPERFWKPVTTTIINKTAIKESIEKGELVAGARMIEDHVLIIK